MEFSRQYLTQIALKSNFIKDTLEKVYLPELLFEDETILARIVAHPAALWRCMEHKN